MYFLLTPVLLFLSFAGIGLSISAWAALIPFFYYLVVGKRKWLVSYFCGFLFFTAGFYWTYHISPLAAPAMGLVFALYFLCSYILFYLTRANLYALPFIWVIIEFIQDVLPVAGVPWFHLAYTQVDTNFIQTADILGSKFVGFIIVLFNVILTDILIYGLSPRTKKILGMFASVYLFGIAYGIAVPHLIKTKPVGETLIVQGKIEQEAKEEILRKVRDSAHLIVELYNDLTEKSISSSPSLIVWPETTFIAKFGFFYCSSCNEFHNPYGERRGFDAVKASHRKFKTNFISGAEYVSGRHDNPEDMQAFNSIIFYDGKDLKVYSKRRLVPFGEYIPFIGTFPFLREIIASLTKLGQLSSFTSGSGPVIFDHNTVKLGPLTCFEIIFDDLVREYKGLGAHLIINCSNEAWFKTTLELDQITSIARVRAIENRIAICRATNSGISSMIDPFGRPVFLYDESGEKKFVRGTLKSAPQITDYIPIFARFGNLFVYACVLFIIFNIIRSWKAKK
ncbi:MAG: apolipoprotein N-acyltransferase [Planctomycetes bacterium]|nr:apolipoprotein N-acyltransferase [Planctomycetota bacterium]